MPGRLDQQPSGVAVAGVGDPALAGSAAAGLLAGHQAQPGPTVAPVKRASRRSPRQPKLVSTATHPASPAGPPPAPRPAWGQLTDAPLARQHRHRPQQRRPQARLVHRSPDAGQPPGCAWSRRQLTRPALAQRQLRPPLPGPQQSGTGGLAGSDQSSSRLPSAWVGTRTLGSPPRWGNRASRWASRRSVLTRPPGGRSSLDGATTTQPTPAAWSARASPNPVGPASRRPRPGWAATPPSSQPPRWPPATAATTPAQRRCPAPRPGSTGQPRPGQPTDALPPSRRPPSLPLDHPSGGNPRHPPNQAPAPKRSRPGRAGS